MAPKFCKVLTVCHCCQEKIQDTSILSVFIFESLHVILIDSQTYASCWFLGFFLSLSLWPSNYLSSPIVYMLAFVNFFFLFFLFIFFFFIGLIAKQVFQTSINDSRPIIPDVNHFKDGQEVVPFICPPNCPPLYALHVYRCVGLVCMYVYDYCNICLFLNKIYIYCHRASACIFSTLRLFHPCIHCVRIREPICVLI